MQGRTFTRAAGVSPPWVLGKCTCRYAAAKSRQTTIAVPRNAGAVAVANPRGAYAPPLLVLLQRPFAGNNDDFCDAETHTHKSGGHQPAVGCEPRLQRPCGEFPRFEFACGGSSTGGLRPPLLVLLQRPFAGRMTIFAVQKRTLTRAAGVSPPWLLGKCTCRYAAAKSRQTTIAVPTNAGAVAVAKPRGAYAPRSWCSDRCSFSGEITPFAMQKRTFTRAAGVSPAWLGNTDGVLQIPSAARQLPHARTTVPSVSPLWVANRVCSSNAVILPVSSSHTE
jgi:hypothetical protein